MYLPSVPCHVIQRGNNRDTCFYSVQDYSFYLECLGSACSRYNVALHAYVLMSNHVHLLMTPGDAFGVSRVMQSLGRRYVQYFNAAHRRSGTLWESRHKASIIEAEGYLLNCMRYIEMNPVRAGMVDHPADYPWSSYRANGLAETVSMITKHECYSRLGEPAQVRCRQYRSLFVDQLGEEEMHAIRTAITFSTPLGDERFIQQVEGEIGRKFGYIRRGRPRLREESASYSV
jgi:putative transposase